MFIRELLVKLGLSVDGASFAEGELAAKGIEKGLEKLVEWGKEAVHAFVEIAEGAIHAADDIKKTSEMVGLTTDALQELRYAGTLSGISSEEMTASLRLLSRQMNAAKEGAEGGGKAFAKLGIHVKDASGKLRPADDVIGDIADKIQKMPDGAEKTALSMQLFGRAGARMVPLLNKGKEGIVELRHEAEELGVVMSEESVRQGEKIDDNIQSFQALWKGIKNAAGSAIFPQLLEISDAMLRWVKANRELIKQNLEKVLHGVIRAGTVLWKTFDLIRDNAGFVLTTIGALTIAFIAVNAAAIGAAVSAAAAWALAAAPFVAIAAVIASIMLLYDDLRVYHEGKGKSVFGLIANTFDDWLKPKDTDPWFVTAIKTFVGWVKDGIKLLTDFDAKINGVGGMFQKMLDHTPIGAAIKLGGMAGDAVGKGTNKARDWLDSQDMRRPSSSQEMYSPEYRSNSTVGGAAISAPVNMTVVQKPGESSGDFAAKVTSLITDHWQEMLGAAAPAVK